MIYDYIISYNAYFDFILANEIHRTHYENLYNKIFGMKDNNVICIMQLGYLYTNKTYKQAELYKSFFKQEPIQQHNAKNDVYTMFKILKYIISHPNDDILTLSNRGMPWSKTEIEQLKKLFLEDNKNLNTIAFIHHRTRNAIHKQLKKLYLF